MVEPLSSLSRAMTVEEIMQAFQNCGEVFSPLPEILKDLGERATAWAGDSLEENEEWHVEPHGVAVWEQYGLAMHLENLLKVMEDRLSQNRDGTSDELSYHLEYFYRLMGDFRDHCQERLPNSRKMLLILNLIDGLIHSLCISNADDVLVPVVLDIDDKG